MPDKVRAEGRREPPALFTLEANLFKSDDMGVAGGGGQEGWGWLQDELQLEGDAALSHLMMRSSSVGLLDSSCSQRLYNKDRPLQLLYTHI